MRQYIVNSWVGAAEYDEGDTYNGEQVGNRNQRSVGVHITRSGDQWHANTAAYAEQPNKPKPQAKKKSAFETIMLADRNYERLCGLSEQLDQELDSGKITDFDAYCAARKNIDKRLAAGWARVCKERSWTPDGESFSNALDNTIESGLHFSINDIDTPQKPPKRPFKRELTGWATIDGLSEDNYLKGLFCSFKRVIVFVSEVKKFLKEETAW